MNTDSVNISSRNISIDILFLSLGFLVLSPVSSYITINLLHFPLALPELLFIGFIPKLRRYVEIVNPFKTVLFISLFIGWFFLLMIGFLYSDIFPVASTSRAWLYIIIFYVIFSHDNNISLHDIYITSVGALIGWLSVGYLNFSVLVTNQETNITYGPMLIVPICLSYSLATDKKKSFVILGILCVIVGFISGLRRELAVVAISIVALLSLLSFIQPANFIKIGILTSVIGFFIFLTYSSFSDYIRDASPFLYTRVISKTENLFNEGSDAEQIRSNFIIDFIENPQEFLLPEGFVNKQGTQSEIEKKRHSISTPYFDVPIIEVASTLGIVVAYGLILYFLYGILLIFAMVKNGLLPHANVTLMVTYIVMFSLLFLEGSYITYAYCAPYTGAILGLIQRRSGLKL